MNPTAQADVFEFLRARAGRIADARLADLVGALSPADLRRVLLADPAWREDRRDAGWTHAGQWHFSTVRRTAGGGWRYSGELATLGTLAASLGLVPQAHWPAPAECDADQASRLEAAGWMEVPQATGSTHPCFQRLEGRQRAIAAYTTFNKTFVPAWCAGGDLYLCVHAATLITR